MATIRGNNSANLLKGTGAADRINGRGGDDTMNGGGGDDVLDGGAGVDRLNGGAGDDTLVWDAADTLVNGAAGADTLWVTSGDLDLTAVADDKIRNVEVIDLTEGDHTLTLARSDVVALSSTTNTLRVEGDAGDAVATTDAGWLLSVNVVIGGETYAQYVNDTAILQVDIDIDHSGIDSTVAAIQLANLNGTNGFRLDNIDARAVDGSFMGWRDVSVASAGDLNGDGFSDLIIGSQNADPGGEAFAGASYVVFGKAHGFASSIDLATLDGTNGFRMEGIDAYDRSGATVASAGDVNGDGFDDLIIRAWEAGPRGESYVVFGKASGFGTNFDFATLDGENGFRLDRGGLSVASAGDVNGDGFADLIIGGIEGRKSYVVFGKASGFDPSVDLATLNGTNGFRLDAADPLGLTGSSVASAGDVNGDGFDDLFIGAPNVGNTRPPFLGGLGPGASYVVFGKASSFANSIDLAALDGSNGFRLDGIGASDGSGRSVSSAGDVNGDGFADLIIVATNADSYAGASYVVFGKASGFESNINLATLDGTNGFRLDSDTEDGIGDSVASAGDVNGDGFDDVIIGAHYAAPAGDVSTGASYVVFGKATGFAPSIDVSTLNGSNGFSVDGIDEFDGSGWSVASAGDVNGDGFDDLIVGAPRADHPGVGDYTDGAGEGYVIFGGDFTGAVTYLGTTGADFIIGTSAADTFVSGQGNDTLKGRGGADVFNAGAGNDRIQVTSTNFAEVDGGSGTDILRLLGVELMLDLTALANNAINGIERINLGGGDNALTLARGDLFDLSDTTNTLKVDGTASNSVTVTDGVWEDVGQVSNYNVYTLGAATLKVDVDITDVSITLIA